MPAPEAVPPAPVTDSLTTRPIRLSAVALILYEREGKPWALFTRRTDKVADHKGQICLPGGSKDPTDESLLATALRETQEELGIDPATLRPVAALEPVFTVVTRYQIQPFVFYTARRPEITPAAFEVAETIDVEVEALLPDSVRRVERWDTHGVARDVYFYDYGPHVIWGATGRMLKHFLDHYSEAWWERVRQGKVEFVPAAETDGAILV
jgi:8-oxo-dGTP pyrophosphatase MutT (NUDIX family)